MSGVIFVLFLAKSLSIQIKIVSLHHEWYNYALAVLKPRNNIQCERRLIMLGINSPREPITPEFSKEIRESLRRAITGQPNEKEKAAQKRLKESEKYWTMEWKGLHF